MVLDRMLYGTKKNKYAFYDVEIMKGLPARGQLLGRKWQEEKVVEMMEIIDQALGMRGFKAGSSLKTSSIAHYERCLSMRCIKKTIPQTGLRRRRRSYLTSPSSPIFSFQTVRRMEAEA